VDAIGEFEDMPDTGKRPAEGPVPIETVPKDFEDAKRELSARLLAHPDVVAAGVTALWVKKRFSTDPELNVVGVGVGEKVTDGRPTGDLCVKILVAKKYPESKIPKRNLLRNIGGVVIDVEQVGYGSKIDGHRSRSRPLIGGVSLGLNIPEYGGTLGCIVVDAEGRRFALSNNHVLANQNRAAAGAAVLQPGTEDGGKPDDRVARLDRFERLEFGNRPNRVDAALARLDDTIDYDPRIVGLGTPIGVGPPELHSTVRKSGRTTGVTTGKVHALLLDRYSLNYDAGIVRMDDVFSIEGVEGTPFSGNGDSGSVVMDKEDKLVGLLFYKDLSLTYAIPLQRVLDRFEVKLAR
jgi:hypothetical protein